MVGQDELSTTIHAVAMNGPNPGATIGLINLLLLERENCEVLSVSGGGGGKGGIIVGPFVDDVNGETHPGRISVDSNGSGSCHSKGVLNVDGNKGVIRADGEPGCVDELPEADSGPAAGTSRSLPRGRRDAARRRATSTGVVGPNPSTSVAPLTRAPIDWRYNCKEPPTRRISTSRAAPTPTTGQSAHRRPRRRRRRRAVGPPGTSATRFPFFQPCTIKNNEIVIVPPGNWVVECDLRIGGELVFLGGNVIFDGDVELSGQATLRFNTGNTSLLSWVASTGFDITGSSDEAAFVYLRDGELSKGSQSVLELDHVAMYVSDTSSLDIGDGAGTVRWIAPTTGPFEDLLMWSESTEEHKFAGGSSLELEGVWFAPHAEFVYTGNSGQVQVSAQFISKKLSTNGAGLLELSPLSSRSVSFPSADGRLIR